MLQRDIVPGVHRIEHAYTNFYLVEEAGRLTIIDAGLPKGWGLLLGALDQLGFERGDVAAIAITHAHFDHLGFAARVQTELDIPVWIHKSDSYIARHPYRYDHEKDRLLYPLNNPRAIPILTSIAMAGGLSVPGITDARTFDAIDHLDVPGRPQVLFVPGHTYGHVAYYFADRNILFTGDALVTLNIYTGEKGPQIISGAATADSTRALAALDALLPAVDAMILPGHGGPWDGGVEAAVLLAKEKGAS
ncbi:MAG TPA: MBL fold metallo-hydrolase [Candidatus Saccharimonadales bacterium]|nr:MBL fold metallo-hydrolase [Candidatus Saccharimonadales bacterium]